MSTPQELIARSNRLGADPKNTNYAGGNTSAKGTETDPVTGEDVELLWVKGSGGDLGTLTESGLAVLRLDRMRALVDVYPGVEREDEMVAAFDYCLHGKGGAAPSIDTAMHGLVDAAHVDHLHPDSGIAIATAADGEAADQDDLRRQGRLGAVAPARASSSASTSPRSRSRTRRRSAASSAGTASPRGATPARSARRTRCGSSTPPPTYIGEHARPEPFGPAARRVRRAAAAERRAKAAALGRHDPRASPRTTGRWSVTSPTPTWCSTSWPPPSTRGWPSSAPRARTTSCAPRSSRWCSTCPADAPSGEGRRPARRSCTRPTARTTRATTTATRPRSRRPSAAPTR